MAVEPERAYRVGLALARLDGLFQDDLSVAMPASWTTGATVTRFRRRWTLSKMHSFTGDYITGQIGFVSENQVTTVFFDHSTGDFIREGVPSGMLVPFAIRLNDGLIAYQLRPGSVRESSFTGAFEALLNTTSNEYRWDVSTAVTRLDWPAWRSGVDSVTRFSLRLDKPNPHYGDDWRVEDLIEDLRVEYARLSGAALDGRGVNTDDDLFRQALDHVLRNYGRAKIDGIRPDGQESTWVKVRGGAPSVVSRILLQLPGPEEVPEDELIGVLARQPSDFSAVKIGELEESDDA